MKFFYIILISILFLGCSNSRSSGVCQSPITETESYDYNGIKIELEITRCSNEDYPIDIKAIATNNKAFPIEYTIFLNSPALEIFVRNEDFALSSPARGNETLSPISQSKTLEANSSITRETTWANTLYNSEFTAPNGNYEVSVVFSYRAASDVIDSYGVSINFTKTNSQNYITPSELFDSLLHDSNVVEWLESREETICGNYVTLFNTYFSYENNTWLESNTNYVVNPPCQLTIQNNKYLFRYDSLSGNEKVKEIEIIKN